MVYAIPYASMTLSCAISLRDAVVRHNLLTIIATSLLIQTAQAETDLPVLTTYGSDSSGISTQSFDADEIRRNYSSLSQFLGSVTGVQVQHSGATGDPVMISVRGASSGQTNILVNGVRVNDAQGGGYDLSSIPLSMIERIELVSAGSNGGDYDSAIGGTLNIVTRREESSRNLRASVGSFGYQGISYRQNAGVISLYAESENIENNFSYPVPAPWDGGELNADESLKNAAFFRHNLQIATNLQNIDSRIYWRNQNKEIPDYFRNSPNNEASYSQRESGASAGNLRSPVKRGLNWRWNTTYAETRETYRDPDSVIGLGNDDNRYYRQKAEAMLSPQWQQDALVLSASASTSFDDYRSRYVNDSDSHACLTPQGQCDQSAEQWLTRLQTGADYQWTTNLSTAFHLYQQLLRSSNWRSGAEDMQKEAQTDRFSGGSTEIRWQAETFTVQLSGRDSIRIPSLYERYGDRGLLLGNDDLSAETARSFSLDGRWQPDTASISGSVFTRHIENAIVPVYDSRGIGRYVNTSEATLTGIEVTLTKDFSLNRLRIEPSFSASRYKSEVRSEIRSFNQQQLAGIYHGRYVTGVSAILGGHRLTLQHEIAGDIYLDRSNSIEGDTRESLDLNYLWQQPFWLASLNISNLTDNRYRDYSNRPATGRSVRAAIEFEF